MIQSKQLKQLYDGKRKRFHLGNMKLQTLALAQNKKNNA